MRKAAGSNWSRNFFLIDLLIVKNMCRNSVLKGHHLIVHAQRAVRHRELEQNASGPTESDREGVQPLVPTLGRKDHDAGLRAT